jgi:L-lysine exporter family protein LysE/ArgO
MDVSLGLACFFGIGAVIEHSQSLKQLMLAAGALFLLVIGTRLMKSKADLADDRKEVSQRLSDIAKACFVLTWFNPQAIIDGSLLFGGYRAALPREDLVWFITGSALASFLWFFCLTGLVGRFRKNITPKVFRLINMGCGGILLFYSVKLGWELMKGISL